MEAYLEKQILEVTTNRKIFLNVVDGVKVNRRLKCIYCEGINCELHLTLDCMQGIRMLAVHRECLERIEHQQADEEGRT